MNNQNSLIAQQSVKPDTEGMSFPLFQADLQPDSWGQVALAVLITSGVTSFAAALRGSTLPKNIALQGLAIGAATLFVAIERRGATARARSLWLEMDTVGVTYRSRGKIKWRVEWSEFAYFQEHDKNFGPVLVSRSLILHLKNGYSKVILLDSKKAGLVPNQLDLIKQFQTHGIPCKPHGC